MRPWRPSKQSNSSVALAFNARQGQVLQANSIASGSTHGGTELAAASRARSSAARKISFPGERMGHDRREIIVARFPAKHGSRLLRIRDNTSRVTLAASRVLDFEIDAGHALNGLDHFENGKATAVSAVERSRGTGGA